MSIGYLQSNLKKLMRTQKRDMADFAEEAAVVYPSFHKIYSGMTKDPRISTLLPVARYFGISVEDLVAADLDVSETRGIKPAPVIPLIKLTELPIKRQKASETAPEGSSEEPVDQDDRLLDQIRRKAPKHLPRELCAPKVIDYAIDLRDIDITLPEPFSGATILFLCQPPLNSCAGKSALLYHVPSESFTLRKVFIDLNDIVLMSLLSDRVNLVYDPHSWIYLGVIESYLSSAPL
jgi:hypothetical protein